VDEQRAFDSATGRPLVDGRDDDLAHLSDGELEIELTVAASDARRRSRRLDAVLLEFDASAAGHTDCPASDDVAGRADVSSTPALNQTVTHRLAAGREPSPRFVHEGGQKVEAK